MTRTLTLLLLALSAPAWSAEPLKYLALVDGGKQAGQLVVDREGGDTVRTDFIFKDNGRGPELKEEYTLTEDGTFASYRVTGTSTFGAKIDETFRIADGKASWKSMSDEGEQSVSGGAQYAPLGGTPQAFSVAMTALAKRKDGKLPLIPSGALTMLREM